MHSRALENSGARTERSVYNDDLATVSQIAEF
jgi:hypothetical protein